MKWACATLVVSFMLTLSAAAQMEMPKPAPELKKADYFAGTWKMEGDTKPGPMGPGGKWTGTEHNEWMEGNFFLVLHSEFTTPMGSVKGTSFIGYDPDEKVYRYHEFDTMGEVVDSKGTLNGDTWVWNSEDKMGGQMIKSRFTMKELSPTSYTLKYEMAQPGGDFVTMMEGKATKQ